MESQGYRVLRFWDDEVLRSVQQILAAIHAELT